MKAVYELKEKCAGEMKVTIDSNEWKEAQEKAFNKIKNTIELKGFRKGKAPESMVRKAVSSQQILTEALDSMIEKAYEFGLETYPDVHVIDQPKLNVTKLDENETELVFNLTVEPEVTLGDYKAVKFAPKKVSVLKKDVDEEIENLRKRNSEEVLKEEGTVEKGNIAVIDFEGFVDGVAFEGGKGTEYPLEIGSGSFIPGFEDQIIGMTTGEEKDINVTFPEEYAKELAGKPAVFKVKVDGIKEKKLPELNDEFVAELKMGDEVKTIEDLTKHIKEDMKASKTKKAEDEAVNDLLDHLCEVNTVEIPEVMITREQDETYSNTKNRFESQGIPFDTYLQYVGQTVEQYKETIKEECEKKVRIRLILAAIGKDMQIVASEQDVADEYDAMSQQYQMEVEEIKKYVPASYLKEDIVNRKTLEALKANK